MFERVPWYNLFPRLQRTWNQGQHVLAIAPTGRGKTVLMQELLPLRDYVVMFGTKTYDEEYDRLITEQGFYRAKKWPAPPMHRRILFWPEKGQTMAHTRAIQRARFSRAIDKIFDNGRWCVCFDELHWMSEALKLRDDIAHMHHQGRSSKLTLVDGFQRPAFVPVIVYSSATHVFVWGTNEAADLKRLSSVAKLDSLTRNQLSGVMGSLEPHEFVYVNVRDNTPPVISQVRR